MKKHAKVILCLVILLSICIYLECDVSAISREEREIFDKLQEHLPKGWNTSILEKWQLEYPENSTEYWIWSISSSINTPKKNINQVIVMTYVDDTFNYIWKSDVFEGEVVTFNFFDMDNNGYDNINLVLGEYNDAGRRFRFLRSYNWNREFTQLVYPKDHLEYFYANSINVDQVDGDPDMEIVIRTVIQENPRKFRVETYCYKFGVIELERETIEPKTSPQPAQEKVRVIEEKDKPFDDFLKANGYGFLLKSYDLYRDGLYLLKVGTEAEGEYNKYMLVEKEHGVVKLIYKIDKMYNDTSVGFADWHDINLDGYVEALFEDMTSPGIGSMLYIVSLTPRHHELLSPVMEWQTESGLYYSQMSLNELKGPMILEDINGDAVPEVGTAGYYNDEYATKFWIWDEKYRTYLPYKLEIWDEETNSPVYIDDPLD